VRLCGEVAWRWCACWLSWLAAPFLQIVSIYDLGDFSDTTSMQNYVKISQIFRCCKGQAKHLDLIRNGSVIKQMIETSFLSLYLRIMKQLQDKKPKSLMLQTTGACSTTHTEVNCRNRSRNI